MTPTQTADDLARVLVGAARAGLMYGYPTDTERIEEIDVVSVLSHMPPPPVPPSTSTNGPEDAYIQTTEWSIRDTETGDILISVGGEALNRERLDALEYDGPGRYELVHRMVLRGRWLRTE